MFPFDLLCHSIHYTYVSLDNLGTWTGGVFFSVLRRERKRSRKQDEAEPLKEDSVIRSQVDCSAIQRLHGNASHS